MIYSNKVKYFKGWSPEDKSLSLHPIILTCDAFSDKPFGQEGSEELWSLRSVSDWHPSGTNSFCNIDDRQWAVRETLRRLQRCVLCSCQGSHLTRVDTAGEEFVQLDQLVWGDVELERDAVEGIIRSHLWWHMRWVTEGTQQRKFPLVANQSVGLFKWVIHAVSLTVNSTVPGGLLFSFFAWFSLLQPSSTSEKMRKNDYRDI